MTKAIPFFNREFNADFEKVAGLSFWKTYFEMFHKNVACKIESSHWRSTIIAIAKYLEITQYTNTF